MLKRIVVTALVLVSTAVASAGEKYSDGRPAATLRLDAKDHGIVLRYGDGPDKCDILGARDVWVFEADGTYYMHYDASGPKGWLSSLAVSKDLLTWKKKGPILDFGKPGEDDAKSAAYGVTYYDGKQWHMFYLGTPNVTAAPNLIPGFPYLTMKAKGKGPAGPWTKQKDVTPFRTKPNTYYSITASPGQVVKNGDEYLQFFSSTTRKPGNRCVQRTLGIARTKNLDGPWTVDPKPMVPIEEQIENSALYYEKTNQTWFLFTNHIGIDGGEYTDAIWVYWSKDLNKWDPANKAVVLDGENCNWSKKCIGLPSVVQMGKKLALFYDAPGGQSVSHMKRHVGLAWLTLPLSPPRRENAKAKNQPMIVAHRGASRDAPENTIPAFKLAWEQGADAIEGDFLLTKDQQIVCIHDKGTKRLAGENLSVSKSTLAELRQLDVGLRHGEKYKGAVIPTIAEVFATVPKTKKIYIEIKCGVEIIPALLEQIEKSGLEPEQIVVICFNAKVLEALKAKTPRYKTSWLASVKKNKSGKFTPSLEKVLETLKRIKADGFSSSHGGIDEAFIKGIMKNGFDHHVWTVDDLKTAQRFKQWGSKSITTNIPGYMKNRLWGQSPNSE
ncbi:MAG: hypothetical protein HN350_16090 [Phycisphaerales bacterium]|nr:hypothetical protein [Phycisphaerales bacterium]